MIGAKPTRGVADPPAKVSVSDGREVALAEDIVLSFFGWSTGELDSDLDKISAAAVGDVGKIGRHSTGIKAPFFVAHEGRGRIHAEVVLYGQ
jgi:hypothetical protein